MLRKTARPVALAVSCGELVHIKQVRTRAQPLQALKGRVLAARHGAAAVALILRSEEFAQRLARFPIMLRNARAFTVQHLRVVPAQPHRRILRAEPARPVARLEAFEFIAAGDGIEKDEVRQLRIQLPHGLRQAAAQRGTREARALRAAALQQIDRQRMLRLVRLHAAHHIQLVRDARALGHER